MSTIESLYNLGLTWDWRCSVDLSGLLVWAVVYWISLLELYWPCPHYQLSSTYYMLLYSNLDLTIFNYWVFCTSIFVLNLTISRCQFSYLWKWYFFSLCDAFYLEKITKLTFDILVLVRSSVHNHINTKASLMSLF